MFSVNKQQAINDFKDLLNAFEKGNIQLVKEFLIQDSYKGIYSRLTNEKGQNLAHLAALYANKEVFELIYEFLKKHNQLKQFDKLDIHGRYPLHYACKANRPEIILRIIQIIGLDAKKQLTTVDNVPHYVEGAIRTPGGKLPTYYLCFNGHLKSDSYTEFAKLLEQIQVDQAIPSLSQPLYLHTLLSRYPNVDKETVGKLYLACLMINFSRLIIKGSDTHPDRNLLTLDQKTHLNTQMTIMREDTTIITNKLGDNQQILIALGENFKQFKKYRKGNCDEFTDVITFFSLNLCPELEVKSCSFSKGGDHVWAKSGNLHIDGWSRDCFFEGEQNRFNNYWHMNGQNFIGPANFNRYEIETELTIKLQDIKDSPVTIDFLELAMLDYEGDIRQIRFDIIKDLIMLGEYHLSAFKRMLSGYQSQHPILNEYVQRQLNYLFLRAADRGDIPLMDFLLSDEWVKPNLVLDAFLKTTYASALTFLWNHPSLSKLPLDQRCAIFIRKHPEHKQALDCYQMLYRHKEALRAAESKEHSLFADKNNKLKQFLCQTLPDSPFEITSKGIAVKESQIFCIQSLVDKIRQNDDKQIEENEDRQLLLGW